MLLASGVEKLELLSTQLSLWNTGRAIATAFVISSVEVGVAWFVVLYGMDSRALSIYPQMLSCQILLSILSLSVALGAYERVCSTLFALVYIIKERESRGTMSLSGLPPDVLAPAPAAPVPDAPDEQAAGGVKRY